MKTYRIYRSIKVNSIEDVYFSNIGTNWAIDEYSADSFASQFGENFIIVSTVVTADQINIAQTNAQWLSEHANESEVVLNENQEITVEFEGQEFQGNTGFADFDETRPDAIECEENEVTDYLETV